MSALAKSASRTAALALTRQMVLERTMKNFIDINTEFGSHSESEHMLRILKTALEHQLIVMLEIVVHKGRKPIGGIGLTVDWAQHHANMTLKDEFDETEMDQNGVQVSTTEIFDHLRTYLRGIIEDTKNAKVSFWFTRNEPVVARLGLEEYERLMELSYTDSERADVLKRGQAIRRMQEAKKKTGKTVLPGLDEAGVTAF